MGFYIPREKRIAAIVDYMLGEKTGEICARHGICKVSLHNVLKLTDIKREPYTARRSRLLEMRLRQARRLAGATNAPILPPHPEHPLLTSPTPPILSARSPRTRSGLYDDEA